MQYFYIRLDNNMINVWKPKLYNEKEVFSYREEGEVVAVGTWKQLLTGKYNLNALDFYDFLDLNIFTGKELEDFCDNIRWDIEE